MMYSVYKNQFPFFSKEGKKELTKNLVQLKRAKSLLQWSDFK